MARPPTARVTQPPFTPDQLVASPAVIYHDIVLAVNGPTRLPFRVLDGHTWEPIFLDDVQSTIRITDMLGHIIYEDTQTGIDITVSTIPADAPDLCEYVVEINPNRFQSPRLAQGLAKIDRTGQRQ